MVLLMNAENPTEREYKMNEEVLGKTKIYKYSVENSQNETAEILGQIMRKQGLENLTVIKESSNLASLQVCANGWRVKYQKEKEES